MTRLAVWETWLEIISRMFDSQPTKKKVSTYQFLFFLLVSYFYFENILGLLFLGANGSLVDEKGNLSKDQSFMCSIFIFK